MQRVVHAILMIASYNEWRTVFGNIIEANISYMSEIYSVMYKSEIGSKKSKPNRRT